MAYLKNGTNSLSKMTTSASENSTSTIASLRGIKDTQSLAFAVANLQQAPPAIASTITSSTARTPSMSPPTCVTKGMDIAATKPELLSLNSSSKNDTPNNDSMHNCISTFENNDGNDDTAATQLRLERSRERNREHARRTRLRKKAQLANLQAQCTELQAQKEALTLQVQDRSIASILLGLANQKPSDFLTTSTLKTTSCAMHTASADLALALTTPSPSPVASGKKRRRSASESSTSSTSLLTLNISGKPTQISITSQINWKTGQYKDEHGCLQQLDKEQLESLRRERNRRHAKMTRDRKKCLVKTLQETITQLQRDVKQLEAKLQPLTSNGNIPRTTTVVSPELNAVPSPPDDEESTGTGTNISNKRICYGFSLLDE